MSYAKRLIFALSLAAAASATAFAGEDSTERLQGFGPAYWDMSCGLQCFVPATMDRNGPPAQP